MPTSRESPGIGWFWAVPIIAVAYLFANLVFGVYRTAWQYGSIMDVFYLGLSVTLVTLLVFGVNAMLGHRPIPLSVNLISGASSFSSWVSSSYPPASYRDRPRPSGRLGGRRRAKQV